MLSKLNPLNWFNKPLHFEDLPFQKKVEVLETRLAAAKSLADQCDIRQQLVGIVFHHKATEEPQYALTGTAQKVYQTALAVTIFDPSRNAEEQRQEYILQHGADYAFLTDPRHRLYKHIQVLQKWGTDARVCTRESNNDLYFNNLRNLEVGRTSIKTLRESYTTIRDEKFHGSDFCYDLNHDAIYLKSDTTTMSLTESLGGGQPVTKLNHNFQIPFHDGHYYLEIVTDCPSNRLGWVVYHSWIRLIDDQGRVTSIGKFPKKWIWPLYILKKK